jgi:hypothetical protein
MLMLISFDTSMFSFIDKREVGNDSVIIAASFHTTERVLIGSKSLLTRNNLPVRQAITLISKTVFAKMLRCTFPDIELLPDVSHQK